ncbi:MAG: hypothetical protein AUI08_00465 [Gemmatimonadetes bacterium 13_2_20CM_2_65_7]|nr:MAG: hypothetical protein AUI08_00465 [Gemmatimonadetes bacterium 13_2_20CM_2_65_7]OLC38611.1 MAG: hypothetical protein AUH75_10585 [Gemmatimonadetes bacterium 13_1_40CM_4_65_7]
MRGTERTRSQTGHRLDGVVRVPELGPNPFRAHEVQLYMIVRVIADGMACPHYVHCDLREPADMITDHEERGRHALLRQRVKNRGRRPLVRTVIEGEINAVRVRPALN